MSDAVEPAGSQPDPTPDPKPGPPAPKPRPGSGSVAATLEGVSKRVGGKRVLDTVSCSFREGELTLIRSPRGAGKTALARLLIGQTWPDAGSVTRSGPASLVGGTLGFLPNAPARRGLDLIAAAFGLDAAALAEAVGALMDDPEALALPFSRLGGRNRTGLLFGAGWLVPAALYVCDGPPLPSDATAQERLAPLFQDARCRAAVVWIADEAAKPTLHRPDRLLRLEGGKLQPDA